MHRPLAFLLLLLAATACADRPVHTVSGNRYSTQASGKDLDELHRTVHHAFIARLEREIKEPNPARTIGNFRCEIAPHQEGYLLRYSVTLTPARNVAETHRVVDMRSTVLHGARAEAWVGFINEIRDLGPTFHYSPAVDPWTRFAGEARAVRAGREPSRGKVRPWQDAMRREYHGVMFETATARATIRGEEAYQEAVLAKGR